jgi:uncharacterized delta-60 repeat protein
VRIVSLIAMSGLVVLATSGVAPATNVPTQTLVSGWGDRGTVRLTGVTVAKLVEGRSGRVLALGLNASSQATVIALRRNGSLDSSFGTAGVVRWPYTAFVGWRYGMALPNGRLLLAGSTRFGLPDTQSQLVLSELDSRGQRVRSFGRNGSVKVALATCLRGPTGLSLEGSRILVAALHWCHERAPQSIALLRFTAAGARDPAFGRDGMVTIPSLPYLTTPSSPLIDDGGDPVVAVAAPSGGRVDLVHLRSDGSRDPRFGHDGVASARVALGSAFVGVWTLFRARLGRFTLAGCSPAGPFLVRFNPHGSPYNFWGGGPSGNLTDVEQLGGAFGARCAAFVQLPSRKLAAAGAVLARLYPSGLLDPFGTVTALPIYTPNAEAPSHQLLVADDGTVLVTSTIRKDTLIGRYR